MKYLKLFENFQTEITYEDIEDTLLNYIDSGDITMQQSSNPESDQDFFTKIPDRRLFYFLQDYVYCLSKDGKLQEDPFKHISHDEDDTQQYFKVPRWKVNTNNKAIHFYLTINNGLTNKVTPDFIDKEQLQYLLNKMSTYATSLNRRFIFQILKQIFYRLVSLYPNRKIDIFYKVFSTYSLGSPNKPFAEIRFRIEFPDEKITESIQKTDWAKVEFSNLGGMIGGHSKTLGPKIIKSDNSFIIKGWTEEEWEKLADMEYKLDGDKIIVDGQKALVYEEGGINILYKIDSDFDRYEVKDDKLYVYFKSGKEDVIDFRNPANESIQVNDFTPDFLDVDILDDSNNKIGSFQLESSDGKNYTIIDALIEEDYRMQGYYRKSIIELLEKHPEISIISLFRSEGAERSWKKILETLPKDFHFTEKHHKEENTTEFKLFKALNFEEVEKETFLSFEYETIDFPGTELKVIQKISPEMKFRLDFYDTENEIHFVTGYNNGKNISIEKKEDGWYLVFQTQSYLDRPAMKYKKYFLCDQFDGLTELLEKYK